MVGRDQQATGLPKRVPPATASPRDNHDAVTAAALGGFDHEAFAIGHNVHEVAGLALVANNPVQLRHSHAGFNGQFLGEHLVIDARKKTAWIQA